MRTITQMREEIDSLMKTLGDMKAKITAENRDPREEERGKAADILDKVNDLEKSIEMQLRIEETEERLASPQKQPTKPGVETAERKKKDQFLTFGEQLQAVIRAASPTGSRDPRLLETRAISGLNETVASEGGFLVQEDFASELIKSVFETGKLASRVRRIPISGPANSIKINGVDESSRATGSRWGGIRMYWLEEAGEKTKSKPKFRQIELKLKKLIGLCYATDELLEDAGALEAVVKQAFMNEMGFMVDDAILNGTGAGQPLGILNCGSLVTQAKETGQDADTVIFENILEMWSRILPDSQPNSVWLINQNVTPQLGQLAVRVGTGGSAVYVPPGGATATPYATLFGRPVIPMEQCATVGDKGDIILGDFGNGYLWADKGGVKQDVSIHVRFVYDESVFRFVYRADGQCALNKPISAYKGTDTLSHFVTLAART